MFRFGRRIITRKPVSTDPPVSRKVDKIEEIIVKPTGVISSSNIHLHMSDFSYHMSKYTGQTVTVFTKGGGLAGRGFTGILLYVNSTYLRLIIRPGPSPALYLCNAYFTSIGTIADIPVDKIASFVHSSI